MKTVNSGDVAVAPARLHRVTADNFEAGEIKAGVGIIHPAGAGRNVAENIRLAAAGRAGTGASEHLQTKIRFRPVIPLNGELVSDLLNVLRIETHELSIMPVRFGLVDLESNL